MVLVHGSTVLLIGQMIPRAGDWYFGYVLGYSLILWGSGALFTLPARAATGLQSLGALSPILAPYVLAVAEPDDRAYYRQTREARWGQSLEQLAAKRAVFLAALDPVLEPLRQRLAETPFLCGEKPAYADYLAFAEFQWARSVCDQDILAPEDQAIRAWRHCMLDLFDGLARSVPAFETAA